MRARLLTIPVLLVLGCAPALRPSTTVHDGVSPDPDWAFRTLEGEVFTLRELRGRPVFVNLWATWCPPCVAELGSIDRLALDVGDHVAFVLVTPEDASAVSAFLRRNPMRLAPVLEETLAPEALGAVALPHTAIIGPGGELLLSHRGAARWDTPEMVEWLRSLGDGY